MENAQDSEVALGKRKRERSPDFPYLGLASCISLVETLYDEAKSNDVRLEDLAKIWGLSSAKGSLLRYVAAINAFGLVEVSGSKDQRKVRIGPDGRRILEDDRPGVREELTDKLALRPKIVREIYEGTESFTGWGAHRPNDQISESALKFDLGFTADAARRFIVVYDETVELIKDKPVELPPVLPREENLDPSNEAPISSKLATLPPVKHKGFYGGGKTTQILDKKDESSEQILNDIHIEIIGGKARVSALLDIDGLQKLKKNIQALEMLLSVD